MEQVSASTAVHPYQRLLKPSQRGKLTPDADRQLAALSINEERNRNFRRCK